MALADVRFEAVVLLLLLLLLLLLIRCFIYLPLFVGKMVGSVFGLCFGMHYFVPFLVLQSSWRGREKACCFACCLSGVLFLLMLFGSSSCWQYVIVVFPNL